MSRTVHHSLAAIAALVIVVATWAPLVVVPADPAYASAPVIA